MHSYRPSQSLAYGIRLMRSPGGTWGVRYQDMSGLRGTDGICQVVAGVRPTAAGCCCTLTLVQEFGNLLYCVYLCLLPGPPGLLGIWKAAVPFVEVPQECGMRCNAESTWLVLRCPEQFTCCSTGCPTSRTQAFRRDSGRSAPAPAEARSTQTCLSA